MSYYYPSGGSLPTDKPPGVYGSMVPTGSPYGLPTQNGVPQPGPGGSSSAAFRSPTPPYGSALAAAANPPTYVTQSRQHPSSTMYGSSISRSPYANTTTLLPSTTLAYPQATLPPATMALSPNLYMPGSSTSGLYPGVVGMPTANSQCYPQTAGMSAAGIHSANPYASTQYGLGLPSPTLAQMSAYTAGTAPTIPGSGAPIPGYTIGVPAGPTGAPGAPSHSYPGAAMSMYARQHHQQ